MEYKKEPEGDDGWQQEAKFYYLELIDTLTDLNDETITISATRKKIKQHCVSILLMINS